MKKLAIVGASYLQRPLVEKANEMGMETHVFAWEEGNVVGDVADYYYPISILEKKTILEKCEEIKIDGITSIASDVAMPTVNYVADKLNLVGNTIKASQISTDKFEMRKALSNADIPCPYFAFYDAPSFDESQEFDFPVIVKPTDRSGARGVTKVDTYDSVNLAIEKALASSINNGAIVEEFIEGREFSVEMISFRGTHYHLAITDKVTTGPPYFVEKEHHQPAKINDRTGNQIIKVIKKALSTLDIENGASHSEFLLTSKGEVRIVEIAGRMGGDFIGSELVSLSTGYDFVKGVIQIALNEFVPVDYENFKDAYAGVYYIMPKFGKISEIKNYSENFEYIDRAIPLLKKGEQVSETIDSADKRAGVVVYTHPNNKVKLNPEKVLVFNTITE